MTTSSTSGVVANAQRIVLALHEAGTPNTRTEIVAQIGVPTAGADYGVLIPVPSTPTIDPTPIAIADLDELDRATAPTIVVESYGPENGGGCSLGCGAGAKAMNDVATSGNVTVSAPVNVGPTSVVVLASDDSAALTAWLDTNGFAIPAEQQGVIDGYVAGGYQFIAITRSETAPPMGPSSIGLHYTLAGDHRQLSLSFARLGAAPQVSFTVFVMAPSFVSPQQDFWTFSLDNLDPTFLKQGKYSQAVATAVASVGSHAFVLENTPEYVEANLSAEFRGLLGLSGAPPNYLTRMSTIVAADALDTDVRLDGPGQKVSSTVTIGPDGQTILKAANAGLLALVLLARALRRRMRRRGEARA